MSLEFHRLYRLIRFLTLKALHLRGTNAAIAIALCLVSILFLIVGISRTVEFQGLGLPARRRRILISLHVTGCLFFALALVLFAIDADHSITVLTTEAMGLALALLLPIQFYLFRLRRKMR